MGKENRKSAVMPQKHSGISEERKNILKPNSSFYLQEAYKSLRTNVNFSLADTEGGKVILITSASQGEGKSLTALNLAISFAQTDCSVLIIDCDLRRPKLNRLMNISDPAGISNVIMNPSFFDVALRLRRNTLPRQLSWQMPTWVTTPAMLLPTCST